MSAVKEIAAPLTVLSSGLGRQGPWLSTVGAVHRHKTWGLLVHSNV